jgi:hypothetical protein
MAKLLSQVYMTDTGSSQRNRLRQHNRIRGGIRNFLDQKIQSGELHRLYNEGLNDAGRTAMILQIYKCEIELQRLELEKEKSVFERMSDSDIDRVCQWLDARHKQNQIEVTVTTHEQESATE